MIPFLKDTARQILDSQRDLKDLVIVLPNRRAGLFFTRYLGELIENPVWMPEVRTIEQVFYGLAGNTPADELTLIFELYELYRQIQEEPEDFDRFYFWGELILKDFNDLDQFMAPAKVVYQNLAEIKEFESDLSFLTEEQKELISQFWLAFARQNEQEKEKFLRFWQILGRLYDDFQHRLKTAGLANSGQLYRQVAENLDQIPGPKKHYIFVGFNAFTLTEEKLIKHFVKEFGAEVFWDLDQYYLQDPLQEAGLFFRDYQKDKVFGKTFPEEIPDQIRQKKDQIKIHSIPLKTNQANLVGKLLEAISEEEPLEETVIILPDEQLLFPVLHSLPEQIDKLNVTMGYPVRNAPVYAFLDAVLELQRYVKEKEAGISFYHKPVTDLLSFPYLMGKDEDHFSALLEKIKKENILEVPQELLLGNLEISHLVFQKVAPSDLFDYLGKLIEHLAKELQEDEVQRSYLFQAYKQLNRIKEIFHSNSSHSLKMDFVLKLFRQIFRELKLPFEGEPLQGLQIMGVLESRNLDFRRVIICDVNEGSFPPGGGINSMIPFNLRRAFGLPVQEQNDAIYAYTFYRLLHRAEEVHLIYTTSADQGKAGEMSRFIQQMQAEMEVSKPEIVLVPVGLTPSKEISIQKTPEVLESMKVFLAKEESEGFTKPLSASALNMYLDCPLKFYFRYVAGLKEKEEVVTEIDPSTFGTILHGAMEHLYGLGENNPPRKIDSHEFDRLIPQVPAAVDLAIRDFYQVPEGQTMEYSGQLEIAREIFKKYLQAILEYDQKNGEFTVLGVEMNIPAKIPVTLNSGEVKVALGGVIDRVDLKDGMVRLIDYKTGKDNKKVKSIASLFDRKEKNRNKAAMQTLLYAYFFQWKHPDNQKPLKPGIFNIKEIYNPKFNPFLQLNGEEIQDYREVEGGFMEGITNLLTEILNPENPFNQTEDLKKCEYCPYKEICGR
ncbi:PD-(D/E)XK nuclease superfamily protein [Algoriphagus boseongensis]|uniref:PD-(D/E)XK nuclease superfamily protein n=1 Tax=Algoriphagus boseongensis TaxID=1442587 RepID=A0A4R6T8U6_9BACT|nr:PD-(D/E)XK nuclease family protein [Algoriphagus boseongensis]TDQ19708.1 PD-(D/E)XK nuclease superfamily protein [Algoriphagus boseongensis]